MPQVPVHVMFEHAGDLKPFGCSYIRILLPLGHPDNEPHFAVTRGVEYRSAPLVLVERTWKPGVTAGDAEALVGRIRRDRARLVYFLDDNLLDLSAVPVSVKAAVRLFCREADLVVVSTPALADRLAGLNGRVRVLPNAIDERLFFAPGGEGAPAAWNEVVMGYMGTFTHDRDVMMVVQPLREVLRRHAGSVALEIVGAFANPSLAQLFDGLPVRLLQVPRDDVEYPAFVGWMRRHLRWDFGIAPLADTHFNRTKSDIKFLDYSALGFPGVYSAVPAYGDAVAHEDTGLLVANEPSGWAAALERMVAGAGERAALGIRAREYVARERVLAVCASKWRQAVVSVLG